MTEKKVPEQTTCYLNVDLDLRADVDLSALVDALGPEATAIHSLFEHGAALAVLEFHDTKTPDEAMSRFAEAVLSLSSDNRATWNRCSQRTMNIGIHCGLEPHSMVYPISAETVGRLAAIGADVEVTIYGANRVPLPMDSRRQEAR